MKKLKKFWNFLKEDSWLSFFISLIILVFIIKFIFFPTLSFITKSPLPLVVIESWSLYHESSFDSWWEKNGVWYFDRDIEKEEFLDFPFRNGLNKGDIIFVWGRDNYDIGEIIIFQPNIGSMAPHPIIHRIVSENPFGTKGDHNQGQLVSGRVNNLENIDETNIPQERILGKAAFRVPYLGWVKLIFFEIWKETKNITGIEDRRSGDSWFCY